jgi:hypothetical protein
MRSKTENKIKSFGFLPKPEILAFIRSYPPLSAFGKRGFKALKGYSNADKNRCTQMRSKTENKIKSFGFLPKPEISAFIRSYPPLSAFGKRGFKALKGYSNADKNRCTQMRSKTENKIKSFGFLPKPEISAFIRSYPPLSAFGKKGFKALKGYSNADEHRCTQMRSTTEKLIKGLGFTKKQVIGF